MEFQLRANSVGLKILAALAVIIFGAWFWWATTPVDLPEPALPDSAAPEAPTGTLPGAITPAVRPAPPSADYVGDQACATCHEDVARKFATSAMARSLSQVQDDSTLRALAAEAAIRPGGKCSYRVRPVGAEGWEHSEQMADQDGQVIYDVAVPLHYSMGSGTRGRSYLTNHGGVLTMSSISWYTSGNRWDLSPGFVPDDPRGFSRRVPDECLACHAGRVETIPAPAADTQRSLFSNLRSAARIATARANNTSRRKTRDRRPFTTPLSIRRSCHSHCGTAFVTSATCRERREFPATAARISISARVSDWTKRSSCSCLEPALPEEKPKPCATYSK